MSKLFKWLKGKLKRATFYISKTITAVVLVLGALVNINSPERLATAALVFTFGLPLGLMIFGLKAFSITVWLAIVVIVLFAMNLHNAWEVATSLNNGGLDYHMVGQATAAVRTVTPSSNDIDYLNEEVADLNRRFEEMAERHSGYDGEILLPSVTKSPLLKE